MYSTVPLIWQQQQLDFHSDFLLQSLYSGLVFFPFAQHWQQTICFIIIFVVGKLKKWAAL